MLLEPPAEVELAHAGFLGDGIEAETPCKMLMAATEGDHSAKLLLNGTVAAQGQTGTPPGAGTLFGLAFVPNVGIYFVDDGSNSLNLLH